MKRHLKVPDLSTNRTNNPIQPRPDGSTGSSDQRRSSDLLPALAEANDRRNDRLALRSDA